MRDPPLRVMFLTPYFIPYRGGIERAIEQLAAHIMESPEVAAVGVLTSKYAFPRVPQPHWADRETTPEGIAIFRLKGYPRKSIPLYSVPLVWLSPRQIRRYMEEFNPNVIHFVGDGWFWGHFWAWLWFRRRARFVFTPSFHSLPLSRWWLRPINGFLCRVVDHVIALSRQEAEQVRRTYWVSRQKQRVIGWGAPAPAQSPRHLSLLRAKSGGLAQGAEGPGELPAPGEDGKDRESSSLTILCVGRLGQHKGQGWLLQIYRQARPQFQRPTRLVLVGRDEDAEAPLRGLVRSAGLEGEVIFTGELEDRELTAWYARSDLFVLFSRYEAFGLVFFEAMAHGVPVLTHDVGAIRELLSRGAVVVPRYDAAAAVQQLVRLVNYDNHRQRLGREAQEYALAEFTWPAVAGKYLEIYRRLPGQHSQGEAAGDLPGKGR